MTRDISHKNLYMLIFLAFLISVVARLYWVSYASTIPAFIHNGQVMINTNDGYYFAEGARDLIKGSHEIGDRSPVNEPLSIVTMILYKITPFSLESLMLYMPLFFGSLVVIPIVLIARFFGQSIVGVFAAIFAATTYSYYNRTMAGYYDSDMFALIMPPFVVAFLIGYFKEKKPIWLALTLFFFALSKLLYPQSLSWMSALIGFSFFYTLLFERKEKEFYLALALSLLAVCGMHFALKLTLLALLFYFRDRIVADFRLLFGVLLLLVSLFVYFGGLNPVITSVKGYLLKDSLTVESTLKYFDVVQTVREAERMDLGLFTSRISGSMPVFVLSVVGYALFVWHHRLFVLTLPIVGLGLAAYFAGLRFTVYAVPFFALGFFWLVFWASKKLGQNGQIVALFVALFFASVPNGLHIYNYKVPTVFSNSVVEELEALGKKTTREDYVFAWWDYGYPIRYYADVKNHSDGGKHDGATNFIESFILTSTNQRAAANMMRESVEGYEELIKKGDEERVATLEYLLKKRGYKNEDYEKYLEALSKEEFVPAKKSRDIYLFLPYDMLEIFQTVMLFSNIDLNSGAKIREPFFAVFQEYRESPEGIDFGGAYLDKRTNQIKIGGNSYPLSSFSISYYDKNGKFGSKRELLSQNGELHLIYMPSYHTYVLCDDTVFNSIFIQLFVFENYDEKLFEPVFLMPEAKIFKLKI